MTAEVGAEPGDGKSVVAPRSFQRDIVWNVASFAVVGGLGLVLNFLIAQLYSPAVLGVFNQVLACFIVTAQVAALGIHWSVGKYTAEHAASDEECHRLLLAALGLVVGFGALAGGLLWMLRGVIGAELGSPAVTLGVALIAPGILPFALNKTLMAAVNGRSWMGIFALLQIVRAVALVGGLALFASMQFDSNYLPVILTAGECVLLLVTLALVRPRLVLSDVDRLRYWFREHTRFGLWATPGGVLSELNTRIDVLFVGWYASDRVVGLYSFAAILAEGLYQLPAVVRQVYNPRLTRLVAAGQFDRLQVEIRRGRNRTYALMAATCAAFVLAYPVLVDVLAGDPSYLEAHGVFAILCAGVALSSGYIPFGQLFLQGGRAGLNSAIVVGGLAINVAGNAILVPRFGGIGAAVATAAAWMFLPVMVRWNARRLYGLRGI